MVKKAMVIGIYVRQCWIRLVYVSDSGEVHSEGRRGNKQNKKQSLPPL